VPSRSGKAGEPIEHDSGVRLAESKDQLPKILVLREKNASFKGEVEDFVVLQAGGLLSDGNRKVDVLVSQEKSYFAHRLGSEIKGGANPLDGQAKDGLSGVHSG